MAALQQNARFSPFLRVAFRVASNSQQGSLISGLFSFYLIAVEDRISYVCPRVPFYPGEVRTPPVDDLLTPPLRNTLAKEDAGSEKRS